MSKLLVMAVSLGVGYVSYLTYLKIAAVGLTSLSFFQFYMLGGFIGAQIGTGAAYARMVVEDTFKEQVVQYDEDKLSFVTVMTRAVATLITALLTMAAFTYG